MVVFLENTTDNNKNEWKRISFYTVILNGDTVHNPRAFLVSSLAAVPHILPAPLFSLLFLVSQACYPPYSLQAPVFYWRDSDSSSKPFSLLLPSQAPSCLLDPVLLCPFLLCITESLRGLQTRRGGFWIVRLVE